MQMRDLTMVEIELVSGAGWSEWWGGVQESVQQWMTTIQQFFNPAPHPTAQDIQNIKDMCGAGGVQSVTMTTSGSTTTLTVTGPMTTISYQSGSGNFAVTCFPSG